MTKNRQQKKLQFIKMKKFCIIKGHYQQTEKADHEREKYLQIINLVKIQYLECTTELLT